MGFKGEKRGSGREDTLVQIVTAERGLFGTRVHLLFPLKDSRMGTAVPLSAFPRYMRNSVKKGEGYATASIRRGVSHVSDFAPTDFKPSILKP